ncbi:uncharacterized protein LOC110050915 [Orbicella faveolata]|uniref:uncharacterized protein LOC110050915 n=1 Tax=Orbicella faveolata TaxID=48498 RepID=UPI0009E380A0|nr:uncharacterized protein LOC110050915 [Orbicella faveolata]
MTMPLTRNNLSEEQENTLKKKLIREFPDVDEVVIDVSLRTTKYDESRAREIIKKLKGDDDKQSAPAKATKKEPGKPKGNAPAASSAKAQAAAAAKAKSSSQELRAKATPAAAGGGGLAAAATAAAKAKSSSQELHLKTTSTAAPKTVKSTSPAPPTTTAQKKPAATQPKQAQREMVSVASKTYRSPLLSVPSGPNPANAQGANPLMLLPEWVQTEGPQRQNRAGPQRGIRKGPARRPTTRKVPLNCGAQASNHKGPNNNLVVGSMFCPVSHF